jgi:4-hydroxy-tetrahydrodipicolinate reductase
MNKINIGLFGFGKTGKIVAQEIMQDKLVDLAWIVRRTKTSNHKYASRLLGYEHDATPIFSVDQVGEHFFRSHPVDIIIDFSGVSGYKNYEAAPRLGVKVISAISKLDPAAIEVLKAYSEHSAVLYSPNITLGVNFLLVASQVLQSIAPHADIEIIEEHFRDKKGVSGTALKIAGILGLENTRHVNSVRVGGIVGKHEVIFGLPNQTIRLVHESISRGAFGQGALFAAKWLYDKPPGFYSMEGIISDMFKQNIPVY